MIPAKMSDAPELPHGKSLYTTAKHQGKPGLFLSLADQAPSPCPSGLFMIMGRQIM
ncbi:MAG: hypothetical protein MZV70_37225 [Desulfobacterales bacterium]|nr:hypothetical protein [Desulfobacterales bacterium]